MEEKKRRILCAEDDEDTCALVTHVLGKAGYEVVSAYTYADAITKALSVDFDCYLLDNGLPDSTGVELCKEIREFDEKTPIIFYSGDAFPREIEEALNAGANEYLVKPVDPKELIDRVNRLAGGSRR